MDLTQTLAILATQTFTIIGSMIAVWYAFYKITDKKIDKLEENMNRMDANHREDMKLVRDDMKNMDSKWDQAIQRMDEKWERLFERLLIQDQQRGK